MKQDLAISIENISKKYQIGGFSKSSTIRDQLGSLFSNPFDGGNLKSKREEFWALNDISAEINQGEVVGIIGRNGSGKSTLLKILAKIVAPTKGKITMRGKVASLLEVGTGFNPELTGRENIFLNGAILGMSKLEVNKKFVEIVEFSGVEQFIDTPVKRYSSGMYVRLAFAVAAHLESEILLVDEVLAVGDAEFQQKCLNKMKSLTQTGRTILFVSHQKESIIKLCNHAILLDKGKIIQKSETMNVMQTYEKIAGSNAFSATNMGGHKEIVISEIRVKNLGKKDASKILPSSGIEILTTIESRSKFNIKDCELAISVVSSKGEKVFSISNVMQNQVFTTKYISQAKIICSITQPKLNPGNYSLNVVIKHLGELQDWIANTGGFTISWEDFYHSGIMPVNEEYVLAEAKWNYQKQE